ncbi:uncharacterized protein LOC110603623 isoform X2 [Manihot esculenta]|uniref:Uncharacterized protein n=2 Tax=Manihot esculenta TaxID=3983 RepID=A0A2C9U7W0_MANES|nr:uncharacterized protein LOC110603623 isoform X2 [Manihot esculenta]KAG8635242.1 hypothetical protein MANES_16G012800v8 [Manihot esculenta]OAY25993.1 hypothetical protein MANES_16G012800v8 [Manihot esculenta]
MEMADNPKLDLGSCRCEAEGLEENMGTQKISVLDHINGFEYTAEKSDSFVIDMESFSHGSNNKDINPNSRITLQRSFSRKGSVRGGGGGEKKINYNPSSNDRDSIVAASSPRGASMPDKASQVTVGTTDHLSNPQVHHHITINTTSVNSMNASTESRCTIRRNSFKRPPSSWAIDPKRVLFFFATLSSMGTILLIYFTLSMGKLSADDSALD